MEKYIKRKAVILSQIKNNKVRKFKNGGFVHLPIDSKIYKKAFGSQVFHDGDTIPAVLEVGELVIPKRHVGLVSTFLKKNKIKLPNM